MIWPMSFDTKINLIKFGYKFLRHGIASESDITPCIKINQSLVVNCCLH